MSRSLDVLFRPRASVVVGASSDGRKLGAAMAAALSGSPGEVLLVNSRSADPAAGIHASIEAAVDATGVVPDLAVLCIPAPAVGDALREAAAAGVGAGLVCAGGFAEIGEAGAEAQLSLEAAVADTGVRLLGPNTSGFFVPGRLAASFVPGVEAVRPGGIAVVAASGGVNHALAFDLAGRGEGVSLAVGIGAGIDVTTADVLDHLAGDESTTAICLHIETVPDGDRLLAAVARASAAKPVIALVVGRSDVSEFAQSHTGALATAWRTIRSLLAQAGAVVVDDEVQLLDAASALSRVRLRPAADPGVAVVTGQAGPALIVVDGLKARGVRVPTLAPASVTRLAELLPPMTYLRNPVDTGRPGPGFGEVLGTVAGDPEVDLLITYAIIEPGAVDLPAILSSTQLAAPVVVASAGLPNDLESLTDALHAVGVPVMRSPTAAVNAASALVDDARGRFRIAAARPGGSATSAPRIAARLRGPFDEDMSKDVLDQLGIPTPPRRACADRVQAHNALADVGGPVVVKILDANVTHKTEIGGVVVGVRDASDLDAALDRLEAVGARRFLVEQMASSGTELVVGARRDPVFGPVVVLGIGGVTAEALQDVSVRRAPVTSTDVAAMVDELQGSALLQGFRGLAAVDLEALTGAVAALGQLLLDDRGIDEIEVNPLRVTSDGLLALDCLIVEASDGPQ